MSEICTNKRKNRVMLKANIDDINLDSNLNKDDFISDKSTSFKYSRTKERYYPE